MTSLDSYTELFDFIDTHEAGQARFLGALLYDLLLPQSVIDWGCATGLYLLPFKALGCSVLGLDGEALGGSLLDDEEFARADFRYPIRTDDFSLALCIETAEHLQPEYADQLVENVAYSSPIVFWSAAHSGQGGLHHYNEQSKTYWYAKFKQLGYHTHLQHTRLLHRIAQHPECRRVEWLIPNSMLLERA